MNKNVSLAIEKAVSNLDRIEKSSLKELNNKKPLIGLIGSQWTVATYVIEGNSSKTFKNESKIIVFNIFLKKYLYQLRKYNYIII